MSKPTMNLQDSFLNQVRKENTDVKVVLVDGTILHGTVKGFDNFTLILNSRDSHHLIYKHAIAQMISRRNSSKSDATIGFPSKKKGFNTIDLSKVNVAK